MANTSLSFRLTVQIICAWAFAGLYAAQLGIILMDDSLAWWSILLLPFALYAADAISGIAHFLLDYIPTKTGLGLKELFYYEGSKGSEEYNKQRTETMQRINALDEVIFDFKIHHISPGTLARRSFLKVALPIIFFASLPLSIVLLAIYFSIGLEANTYLFFWFFMGALTVAQYAHSCAHKKDVPPIPKFLQKKRLFLTAEQHSSHHDDLGHDFCMLNGWANGFVNALFSFCRKRKWFDENGLTPQ